MTSLTYKMLKGFAIYKLFYTFTASFAASDGRQSDLIVISLNIRFRWRLNDLASQSQKNCFISIIWTLSSQLIEFEPTAFTTSVLRSAGVCSVAHLFLHASAHSSSPLVIRPLLSGIRLLFSDQRISVQPEPL